MIKTFTMLAHMYDDQMITGWFASEKLDGCRAMWLPRYPKEYSNDPDIEPTGLWTRDGKVIHAPKWWLSHLPNVPLDGELFLDRKSFQETMSIVRRKTPDVNLWKHIKFMAFDMPVKMDAGLIRFKKREVSIPDLQLHPERDTQPVFKAVYSILGRYPMNDIFKVVTQYRILDPDYLPSMLDEVVSEGGEGLMLRAPFSVWKQERSHDLLKVKPYNFMDVTVTGYYYGDGKYYGMMGALEVVDTDGKMFKLSGFTDEERKIPSFGSPGSRSLKDDCAFKVGQKIKVKYRELTRDGIPKEARYER